MDETTPPRRRWFGYIVIWAAIVGGICFAATATVRNRFVVNEGAKPRTFINELGIVMREYDINDTHAVPIDPQPPTRNEIIFRGACLTMFAIIGWLTLRSTAKRDQEAWLREE